MSSEHQASQLRTIGLFKDLSDEQLQRLASGLSERTFQPGEIVVREGTSGEEAFLILEGEFQVFLSAPAFGVEKELRKAGPGDYFGEIALLTGKKRLASIRALTVGRALVLPKQQLFDLIHSSPAAALALCRAMADYVEKAHQTSPVIGFAELFR